MNRCSRIEFFLRPHRKNPRYKKIGRRRRHSNSLIENGALRFDRLSLKAGVGKKYRSASNFLKRRADKDRRNQFPLRPDFDDYQNNSTPAAKPKNTIRSRLPKIKLSKKRRKSAA